MKELVCRHQPENSLYIECNQFSDDPILQHIAHCVHQIRLRLTDVSDDWAPEVLMASLIVYATNEAIARNMSLFVAEAFLHNAEMLGVEVSRNIDVARI